MNARLRLQASGGRAVHPVVDTPVSFETFFEDEALTLFRRMCVVTGNRDEAEEVVQDAFLAVFERWDRVRELDDPVGYLYRTAFNRWKKLSRRAGRHLRELAGVATQIDEFGAVDDRELIDRGLSRLTPRQRAAIVLTEMLGYPSPAAARMLGIRAVTVRTLASQGRAVMRQVMEVHDE